MAQTEINERWYCSVYILAQDCYYALLF